MSNIIYVDDKIGNDENDGLSISQPIKTFELALKKIFSTELSGTIKIINNITIDNICLNLDEEKHLDIKGCNLNSSLKYHKEFGDGTNILYNINFYNLNVIYGDTRWNYNPVSKNTNFYNCIINYSGDTVSDYSNYYNCIFVKPLSEINYRQSETNYHHKGIFINCIFDKKYYTDSTNFVDVIHKKYNLIVDNIDFYCSKESYKNTSIHCLGDPNIKNFDNTISDIGLFGGPYSLYKYFNKYLFKYNNKLYTISDNEIIEIQETNITKDIFEKYGIDNISNINFLKYKEKINNFNDVYLLYYIENDDIESIDITYSLSDNLSCLDIIKKIYKNKYFNILVKEIKE